MKSIQRAPRLGSVRGKIEKLIREQGLAGQRLIGYRRLAAELGACQQTVQRALAAMEADGLVERRHGSGTYVLDAAQRKARVSKGVLALVVNGRPRPDAGWSAVGDMVEGVQAQARRAGLGCELLAWDDPNDAVRLADRRIMRNYNAFVLVRFGLHRVISGLMDTGRGAVVLVDEHPHGLPVTSVTDDSLVGAQAVTRHLLQAGHRRIAFLDVENRGLWNPTKYEGYRIALEAAGVVPDDRLTVAPPLGVPVESSEAVERVDRMVGEWLALPEPPTAIFAYDDRRAFLVLQSLEKREVKVGRDISVAGFGDTAFRMGYCDRLTSCRIDFRRLGREAVRAALEPSKAGEGRFIVVPDRVMIRSSTAGVEGMASNASHKEG